MRETDTIMDLTRPAKVRSRNGDIYWLWETDTGFLSIEINGEVFFPLVEKGKLCGFQKRV